MFPGESVNIVSFAGTLTSLQPRAVNRVGNKRASGYELNAKRLRGLDTDNVGCSVSAKSQTRQKRFQRVNQWKNRGLAELGSVCVVCVY